MHVLCAPDSFKESLTAIEAAEALARGVRTALERATTDVCPIADGGEGSLEVLIAALGGTMQTRSVLGPLGIESTPIDARFGVSERPNRAIIELAEASGLARLPTGKRNPLLTTTFGTGQLMRQAIELGHEDLIVCIGGSATVDGGAGLAQAMGVRFFDRSDRLIEVPVTGATLARIARIECPRRFPSIRVACDVTNPLTGPTGAAAVYGPQKGATPEQVALLDASLEQFASITNTDPSFPGAGAAGGAGFGLVALCGATLESGLDLICEAVDFESRCERADLVLTGEGRIDAQSFLGKASLGIARIARRLGTPCCAIAGQIAEGVETGDLLTRSVSLADLYGLQRARSEAAQCLSEAACAVVREWSCPGI